MNKITIVLLMIFSMRATGQNHFVGLKGNLNLTNIVASGLLNSATGKKGISYGLVYEYRARDHFLVGTGLVYTQKGFRMEVIGTDENGKPSGDKDRMIFNYNYLTVPVSYGFFIERKISGFAKFGIAPSLLVKAKTEILSFGYSEDFDVFDKVNKFDIAGFIEIGGSYRITKDIMGDISFIFQHSAISFTNAAYFKNANAKHYGMAISAGIKYRL